MSGIGTVKLRRQMEGRRGGELAGELPGGTRRPSADSRRTQCQSTKPLWEND